MGLQTLLPCEISNIFCHLAQRFLDGAALFCGDVFRKQYRFLGQIGRKSRLYRLELRCKPQVLGFELVKLGGVVGLFCGWFLGFIPGRFFRLGLLLGRVLLFLGLIFGLRLVLGRLLLLVGSCLLVLLLGLLIVVLHTFTSLSVIFGYKKSTLISGIAFSSA